MKQRPRILLSEGSSTNARETITVLGSAGYRVDVCDPNPACMARFSRFVGTVHRVPASGTDPVGYLRTVARLLAERHYDVLLPVNEQAYLFAWARDLLDPLTGLAVADFGAFTRVQTKTAFLALLDELGLPHPPSRVVHSLEDLRSAVLELGLPCYVKTPEGTASVGLWLIRDEADLAAVAAAPTTSQALVRPDGLLVQAQATGHFEQAHAVFDHGRLVALRTDRRLAEGTHGGPALKQGVARPLVASQVEFLGRTLDWHGGFSADYFWDDSVEQPAYIDANPRLTEPVNALVNGVNLPELQVRLSLGEHPEAVPYATGGARSHGLLHSILGAGASGGGRRGVLAASAAVVLGRGPYAGSREGLTPLRLDPPSAVVAGYILGRVLLDPGSARRIAESTIASYSLGPAIPLLAARMPPRRAPF
jgi:hypothetical protein